MLRLHLEDYLMRPICLTAAFCFAAVLAGAGSATAKSISDGGLTTDEVAAWMTGQGIAATVQPNPDTPPSGMTQSSTMIRSDSNGVNFEVYSYDCADNRCKSLQLAAGWSGCQRTTEQMNDWNSHKRWGKGHKESNDGACWIEMDV